MSRETSGADGRFNGQTVLVTGAARGIGRATVERLAAQGARVIAHHRTPGDHVDELVERTGAIPVRHDLLAPDGVTGLLARLDELVDGVNVVVNNAGMLEVTDLESTTDGSWDRTVELNLTVPFQLLRALLPRIASGGGGAVVNVASIAGVTGGRLSPAYAAAKGGLVAMTRYLATEWAPRGVRVNAVAPTLTDTDMIAEADLQAAVQAQVAANPMGRLAQPDEIASTIAFLASNEASYVNGQCLLVTGMP